MYDKLFFDLQQSLGIQGWIRNIIAYDVIGCDQYILSLKDSVLIWKLLPWSMYCFIKTTKKKTFQIYRPSHTISYWKFDRTQKKEVEKEDIPQMHFWAAFGGEKKRAREWRTEKKTASEGIHGFFISLNPIEFIVTIN